MGKLDVGAAYDLYGLNNVVRPFLKPFLQFLVDSKHGGSAIGVARVHAHGIHIFDKTDSDHLVLGVAHDFEFQFLPSQDRLLHQHLAHHARRDTAAGDGSQFFHIIYQAAARSSHGIGRPDDHRVVEFSGNFLSLLYTEGRFAPGHLYAEAVHGLLECDPVLAALDGIDLNTDYLDTVFIQHACSGQF